MPITIANEFPLPQRRQCTGWAWLGVRRARAQKWVPEDAHPHAPETRSSDIWVRRLSAVGTTGVHSSARRGNNFAFILTKC